MWWEKRKKFWKAGLAKKNRKTYYEKRNVTIQQPLKIT
jgi:hypothetical protein